MLQVKIENMTATDCHTGVRLEGYVDATITSSLFVRNDIAVDLSKLKEIPSSVNAAYRARKVISDLLKLMGLSYCSRVSVLSLLIREYVSATNDQKPLVIERYTKGNKDIIIDSPETLKHFLMKLIDCGQADELINLLQSM